MRQCGVLAASEAICIGQILTVERNSKMRGLKSMSLAAAAALYLAGGAHAATFNFSYSFPTSDTTTFPSGQTSASGVFTADDEMDGSFLVTDVSGTWNGEAITGVAPLQVDGGNDNLIFPTANLVLDVNGVAFSVAGPIRGDTGDGYVNDYLDDMLSLYTDNNLETGYSSTFNLAEVSGAPEPSAWVMMIFGVGLVGSALRRKASAGLTTPA